eukprot:14468629-Alexandrium_andersonii.AAC.1
MDCPPRARWATAPRRIAAAAARAARFLPEANRPTKGAHRRRRGSSLDRPSLLHRGPKRWRSSGAELAHRAGFRT